MYFEFFVGWRYLRAKSKNTFISIITYISIAGVTVGVMALLVVISVMNGFDRDLREKILGAQSHLIIEHGRGIINYEEIIPTLKKIKNIQTISPAVVGQGLVRSSRAIEGVYVKGIVADDKTLATDFAKNMYIGKIEDLNLPKAEEKKGKIVDVTELEEKLRGVILGKELATKLFSLYVFPGEDEKTILKEALGQRVKLISPILEEVAGRKVPRSIDLKVVGIFDTGMYDFDSGVMLVSLETAQLAFGLGARISRIETRLVTLEKARQTAAEVYEVLHNKFQRAYIVRTWMDMSRTFFEALKIEKITMFVILTLIILVGAFNIASTLIMTVMERTREIGVLKSLGTRRRSILGIFLIHGVFIGSLGTGLGCLLAWGICLFLKHYGLSLPGGGAIYYIDKLPVQMQIMDFVLVATCAIILSLIASLYPSWQAARLRPAEALRYE